MITSAITVVRPAAQTVPPGVALPAGPIGLTGPGGERGPAGLDGLIQSIGGIAKRDVSLSDLKLDRVSNTADTDKPVSNPQALALVSRLADQEIAGAKTFPVPPRITTATPDQYGVINVDSAGADATGQSDAHVAFQVCLDALANQWAKPNSGPLALRIPGRRYLLSSAVQLQVMQPLTIEGNGGVVRQTSQNAFYLYGDGARQVPLTIRGLTMEAALPGSVGFILRSITGGEVFGVGGQATASGRYDALFDIANTVQMSFFGGVTRNLYGGVVSALSDLAGSYVRMGLVCLNITFTGVQAQGFQYFINADTPTYPGIEGIFCNNCIVNPVRIGVYVRNTGYLAPGSLRWSGGHIEAHEQSIKVVGCAQVDVSGALLYRNTLLGNAGETILLTGCAGSNIAGNGLYQVGSGSSGGSPAISVQGGSRHAVENNKIVVSADVAKSILMTGTLSQVCGNRSTGSGLTGNGVSVTDSTSQEWDNLLLNAAPSAGLVRATRDDAYFLSLFAAEGVL